MTIFSALPEIECLGDLKELPADRLPAFLFYERRIRAAELSFIHPSRRKVVKQFLSDLRSAEKLARAGDTAEACGAYVEAYVMMVSSVFSEPATAGPEALPS